MLFFLSSVLYLLLWLVIKGVGVYKKRTKDREGAVAELIGVQITEVVGIQHPIEPADVEQPSSIDSTNDEPLVIMPRLMIETDFANAILEGTLDRVASSPKFHQSLGGVLAHSWLLDQGDLNVTNVLIHEESCYPFDFDCAFIGTQSPTAEANKMKRQFKSADFKKAASVEDILEFGSQNLISSADTLGVGEGIAQIFSENREQILRGIKAQLQNVQRVSPTLVEMSKDDPDCDFKADLVTRVNKVNELLSGIQHTQSADAGLQQSERDEIAPIALKI